MIRCTEDNCGKRLWPIVWRRHRCARWYRHGIHEQHGGLWWNWGDAVELVPGYRTR